MQIEREKNMTKFLKLVYASIFLLYLILGLRDGASQSKLIYVFLLYLIHLISVTFF